MAFSDVRNAECESIQLFSNDLRNLSLEYYVFIYHIVCRRM
jgi:hypothetical protein